ncbi:MAG: hypothetical protein EBU49_10495, partial [Proteobacteria bacterium]|nr:hypothetical protein [Pseudomonadota bacterium]
SLREVCRPWQLTIVEDAAEALGSFYKEQHVGTMGELGIVSFNGNKIITTGGGGMILTNQEKMDSSLAGLKGAWDTLQKQESAVPGAKPGPNQPVAPPVAPPIAPVQPGGGASP